MTAPRADQLTVPVHVLSVSNLADLVRVQTVHPDAVPIGGGTLAVPSWLDGPAPAAIVQVNAIAECRERQAGKCGSAVTLAEVSDDRRFPDALRQAAGSVGSPALRTIATVGGNVAAARPGCLSVALLALRASAVILVPGEHARTRSRTPTRTALLTEVIGRATQLIVEFRWPSGATQVSALRKVAVRAACGQAILTVAVGQADGAPGALAIGGTGLAPRRLAAAEAVWAAKGPPQAVADAAAGELTTAELSAARLGDEAYYRSALGTLVRRAMAACGSQAGDSC